MAFILLLPFFLIRFGLLAALDRNAVARAAYFPPLFKREKPVYWVYQLLTAGILLSLFFLKIKTAPPALFYGGAAVYLLGMLLLIGSVVDFAAPSEDGFNRNGLYRLSRNPMYIAYFLVFTGCALLTGSPLLFLLTLLFQLSAHTIIRSEERWCLRRFGGAYLEYMKTVRRYL